MKYNNAIINSFFYDDLKDDVIMLDRICKENNIIQINSEDDPYVVMEADDYRDSHDCDDDMFEDDDQLVYVDKLGVAHPLNIVKHIHERFYYNCELCLSIIYQSYVNALIMNLYGVK